jgi:hypothetical protein
MNYDERIDAIKNGFRSFWLKLSSTVFHGCILSFAKPWIWFKNG